jgi:hypothetical protein
MILERWDSADRLWRPYQEGIDYDIGEMPAANTKTSRLERNADIRRSDGP